MSTPALSPDHLKRSKSYTRLVIGILEVQAFIVMGVAYYFYNSGYSALVVDTLLDLTQNYFAALALFTIAFFGLITIFTYISTVIRHALDRRFGVNKAPVGTWLRSISKVIWLKFGASVIGAGTVFVSARFIGFAWWIPAAILSAIYVYLLFAWYAPAMLGALGPEVSFPEGPLRERLLALCRRAGVPVQELYEWRIGQKSSIGNAMIAGLGKHRRILISDTLCEACTDDEIEAILAHELGHEANNDVRSRALYRLVTQIVICWIVCQVPRLYLHTQPSDFSTLPALWLGYTFLSIYAQIGLGYSARRQEKAADLYAWKLMGTSTTLMSGLQKLTALNLIHVKKGSRRFGHPSLEERMEEAARFEASLRITPKLAATQ